jgi:hypothetical protein
MVLAYGGCDFCAMGLDGVTPAQVARVDAAHQGVLAVRLARQCLLAAGGTIAFEVEDLDRLMTDLKGKGVIFKGEVIHCPVRRMAVYLDSEGTSILLHQLKPK